MNKNALIGVIKTAGDRQEDLARALELSLSALSAKINGKHEFKLCEIQAIRERYQLTKEQIYTIFFTGKVSLDSTGDSETEDGE